MTYSTPNVRKFESIAIQARRITASIRVDVADGYVLLTLICRGIDDGIGVEAGYTLYYGPDFPGAVPVLSEKPERSTSSIGRGPGTESYMWRDQGIGNSLRWLVEDWGHGTPDFDSIQIETKKSPVKGAELKQLLLAIWLEAFGHEVPDELALADRVKSMQAKNTGLRTLSFEWLRQGPDGVEKWNRLRHDERDAVGKLGKCLLSACDLRGVYFGNQDLRDSDFREANLQKAHFGGADCRDVDFRGADLSEAWMSGGRFLNADFGDALLRGARIRAADCRGAVFAGADAGGVDFSFADLRDVDLSSVRLNEADLFRIKYNEGTVFPAGFVVDPEKRMEWKGAVQREAEYSSNCTLEELLTLIPAPPTPVHAEGDWDEAEALLGIRFPADFKQLIAAYGSGKFFGELRIFNPLTDDGRQRIADELELLEELREGRGWLLAIHPEESGVLPWGFDSHGNWFCWLVQGEPDVWPTAQLDGDADEPESDDVNMTTFLCNYARNQYPEMLGGLRFEESQHRFSTT